MNCIKCSKPLKQRQGKFGEFWGCTGYPACTYTFTEVKGGYPSPKPSPDAFKSPVANQNPSSNVDPNLLLADEVSALRLQVKNLDEFIRSKLS